MNAPPRLLVVEDEAPQREALVAMLRALWPEASDIDVCEDGLAALECIDARMPQVAFLDIRLPGMSGLEVARAVQDSAHVVFTTAYDEYAVRAFETGAVDYLLKPISEQRLSLAIDRLKSRLAGPPADIASVLAGLHQHLQARHGHEALRWITASVGDTVKMFPVEDVLFFQAQEKYTRVVTAADEAIIRMSLKELLAGLDRDEFWQVHRSVIVRASAVDRVRRDELGKLGLRLRGNDEVLPVSQAFQHRFRGM